MKALRASAHVERSAGRGLLSAVISLMLTGFIISCKRVSLPEQPTSSQSPSFAEKIISTLHEFPFEEPVHIYGWVNEMEGTTELAVEPAASGTSGEKVIVYYFAGECCMKDGKPCAPVAEQTTCWSKDCVGNATERCYDKYPGGCVAIDFYARGGKPGTAWEAGWQGLQGLSLTRPNRELIVHLKRTSKGWTPACIRIVPYRREGLVPLPPAQEPCSPEFEGVFWYSTRSPEEEARVWQESSEGSKVIPPPASTAGEVTTVRALVQALQEKVPPQEKELYVTISASCKQ